MTPVPSNPPTRTVSPTRRQLLRSAALAGIAATPVGSLLAAAPAAAADAAVDDVGEIPNYTVGTPGADIGVLPDGSARAWLAVNGAPATLAEVDLRTDEVRWQLPLPGAQGGWAVAGHTDGTVYAGSFPNGTLYRWLPGAASVEVLGRPTPDTTFIWALDTDEDGNAYGGTYTTSSGEGRVFAWNAATGQFRDYGPAMPGQAYVRALVVHGGTIYAGTAPEAHVVAIDIKTGERRDLGLRPGEPTGRFVHDLAVAGRYLLVRVQGPGMTFAYDLAAQTWTDLRIGGFGRATSGLGPRGEAYVDVSGSLVAVDVRAGTARAVGTQTFGTGTALRWLPEGGDDTRLLAGVDDGGVVLRYDPRRDETTLSRPALLGAPVTPQSLGEGPDGLVYVGGYPSGGLAAYDPVNRRFLPTRRPFPQVEGMGSHAGRLYLGTYSGAQIHEYDPARPWQLGVNPRVVLDLGRQQQDRPFAVVSAGQYLAIGTVPAYGTLGGVLSLYDPATGTARTWRQVVADQSVISLAYQDGVVYGGTSVWGGLGAAPTTPDGKVFAVDVATGEKRWELTPVPGDRAVSSLTFGADGALWGLTGGRIFRLDTATGAVSVVATVADVDWGALDHYWRDGFLRHHPASGMLHGAAGGRIFSLDPRTGEVRILATGTSLFLAHSSGRRYWTKGFDLIEATV
ncbi:PQQ-binding-like beta-propeller repeat protein [Micromonospora sp. DR5-3]|uniref:outer membrane protein assembly factor BamB family protein n=1 Tax=unclassified Micromonospora TaxID=2617518 RepID=UPI0011D9EA35|nr:MULTISPECIES: PQQ-binding-like beta-propeller repeat protein [unclassified Micromonospora]MCW3820608.1 PQQ-binding-like beta-propeller repeat protein [Micromonospora sp. DR5-3]TYC19070.1 PQQ-binding-like beta-propeller repeat protein [Micromonospora sp. MP36]